MSHRTMAQQKRDRVDYIIEYGERYEPKKDFQAMLDLRGFPDRAGLSMSVSGRGPVDYERLSTRYAGRCDF